MHVKKDCPKLLAEINQETQTQKAEEVQHSPRLGKSDTYLSSSKQRSYQRHREEDTTPSRAGRRDSKPAYTLEASQERVDRHGNTYGARVATKQTRVPPPKKRSERLSIDGNSWKPISQAQEPESQGYQSPPYTKKRDQGRGKYLQNRTSFPQKGLSEWRAKPHTLIPLPATRMDKTVQTENQDCRSQSTQVQPEIGAALGQTEEQVMDEINDATLQYLNHPDPTEANARRQRVMIGDARGQTEEAAARIMNVGGLSAEHITTSTLEQQKTQEITEEQVMQELQEVTLQYLSSVDPVEAAARRQRVLESDAKGLMENTAAAILATTNGQRRSLSPWERGIRSESPPGIDFDLAMQPSYKEDTPPPVQNREKNKHKKEPTPKSTSATPNILNGMSARKRNISQMRFSPGRGKKSP
ncbi:unnamed protein product [Brassica oleracea var. botrytis]|uniref:Uncharacterized protein n=2 Tax=Brassica TaxID=3705 RepID=A0A3P6GN16_BRAOL|nr:unnamed protein product [Brassica napus]VDD61236.1 unnamed protein product [Brassica oleracea]